LLSDSSLPMTLKPGILARAPSSSCSHVICLSVALSGVPCGKRACLILAFFCLRMLATVCPAKSCTISPLLLQQPTRQFVCQSCSTQTNFNASILQLESVDSSD